MNIVSPRLEFCGWTPFPTLSISDAERRAYHNRRVSDTEHGVTHNSCTSGTAAAAVSTTRLRLSDHHS